MMNHTVKILLLDSGERLPIRVNRLTGIPEFYPNLYVVTEQRQINLSTATIKRTLHELSVFSKIKRQVH